MNHHSFIVFLGLGSSQQFSGKNSENILLEAFKKIQVLGKHSTLSSFIKSDPWGGVAQNIFVNAVCRIEISEKDFPRGSEEKFLDILQSIEKQYGRVRDTTAEHWGDRTLDIDILFWGDQKIMRPRLHIPHPYIWDRNFVYRPLQEITTAEEYEKLKGVSKNPENSLARKSSFS